MDFEAAMKKLQTLPGTTQEEFDRMKAGILALASSVETQEYTDEQTGMRLTVEYDIPEHPLITAYAPEHCTLSIEEANAAIHRLLVQTGLMSPEQPGQAAQGGKQ